GKEVSGWFAEELSVGRFENVVQIYHGKSIALSVLTANLKHLYEHHNYLIKSYNYAIHYEICYNALSF
ncbi:MAG: hypothetical protein AAFV93_23520, partial [Chloroflexota bacterium]